MDKQGFRSKTIFTTPAPITPFEAALMINKMRWIIDFSTAVSKSYLICSSVALYIYSKADYAILFLARAWMLIMLTKLDIQFQVLVRLYQNAVTVIILLLIRISVTINDPLFLEQPLWMFDFPLEPLSLILYPKFPSQNWMLHVVKEPQELFL